MKGERIKVLREEKGLNQKQLAGILSVSTSSIGMYEKNLREPDDIVKIRMAKFFDCSIDYLLGLSNFKKNPNISFNIDNFSQEEINEIKVFISFLKYKKKNNLGKGEVI